MGFWCARQDAGETETQLNEAAIRAARIVPMNEIYSRPDPHFAAAGFITGIDHPEVGTT